MHTRIVKASSQNNYRLKINYVFRVHVVFFRALLLVFGCQMKTRKKLKFNFCECAKINKQQRNVWIFKIEDRPKKITSFYKCA